MVGESILLSASRLALPGTPGSIQNGAEDDDDADDGSIHHSPTNAERTMAIRRIMMRMF